MAAPACLTVTLVRLTHTISTNFRIPHKKKWAEVLAASTSTAAPLLLHNQTQMASAIWAAYGCHLIQSVEYVYHLHQAPFDDKVAWLDERQSARSQKRRHLATLAEPLRSGKSVRPCCSFYPPPTRSPPHICIQRHSKGPRPDLCSQIPSQLCGANFFRCSVDNRHGKGMYIVKNYKRQTTPKLLIFFLSHCKTAQLYFSSPKYESIILQSI